MHTFEPAMTFLASAKLIMQVLLPPHLNVAGKADPGQPHQPLQAATHAALSLSVLPTFLNTGRR